MTKTAPVMAIFAIKKRISCGEHHQHSYTGIYINTEAYM
jgi:hypothetical protein